MSFALHVPPFCRPDLEHEHRLEFAGAPPPRGARSFAAVGGLPHYPDPVHLGLQSFLLDCISTAVN
jgi:hypothetical protein